MSLVDIYPRTTIARDTIDDGADEQHWSYAAGAFEAVLRGQVTIKNGEPLVILSDTHWYWWMVRVVRTGQVGFVPGELVELPNERLARRNSEKNILIYESDPPRTERKRTKCVRFKVDCDEETASSESTASLAPLRLCLLDAAARAQTDDSVVDYSSLGSSSAGRKLLDAQNNGNGLWNSLTALQTMS